MKPDKTAFERGDGKPGLSRIYRMDGLIAAETSLRLRTVIARGFLFRSHTALATLSLCACLVLSTGVAFADVPKRLTIAQSATWTPYAFLGSNGEPNGLLIDLWRLFGEKNDVEIVFNLVDWSDSLDLVRNGDADAHGGLLVSENRSTFLEFSREIGRVRTLLFVPRGTDEDDLAEMADKPVGVVAATFDHEFIETHFPQVNLRTYPNARELVEAALRDEVKAFVADYPTGHYHLLLLDAINEFHSIDTLYTEGIHVAVRKGATELLAFLDAGFGKITEAEIDAIRDRWLIPSEPTPRWILPVVIATGISLFLIALGAHYLSLRRTVDRRTRDLNATIRELEIANGKLERLARIDHLTEIYNRQAFFDRADQEVERAKRYARPLSLALFDLDHFKQVNDRFGHLAGDAVLKGFADAMREKLRETDLFARLGGDEFVALLPETTHHEAVLLARRILQELRHERVKHENEVIDLSFSAGVAEFDDDSSIEDWIKRADKQLYRSKVEGRAQVTGTRRDPRPGPAPSQA